MQKENGRDLNRRRQQGQVELYKEENDDPPSMSSTIHHSKTDECEISLMGSTILVRQTKHNVPIHPTPPVRELLY